jgi:serine protease AprX
MMRGKRDGNTDASRSWHSVRLSFAIVAAASMTAAGVVFTSPSAYADAPSSSYVVLDLSNPVASVVTQAIQLVGGTVVESLGADGEIEATLTRSEVVLLGMLPGVEVVPNMTISLQSAGFSADASQTPAAVFAQQTGATQRWAKKDTGQGVNAAVLDTGISPLPDFAGRLVGGVDLSGEGNPFEDSYGHGTFVAGLIAGSGSSSGGQYTGEAPGAGLVSVKVAGASGSTNLATVIAGVGWTIAHAKSLNIRVLNMSLGFVPWESTSLNPLDQAVQQAWESDIVVVTSAGNAGPFNGTILSPGDDPYVITIGALNDLGQTNPALDTMTTFSSSGPTTPDGFYKPDLVASGKSVISLADPSSTIYEQNPSARVGSANFVGSGTSFSAAITSGAVALDLEMNPKDKPDDVKARLLATALPGPSGNPFVDGHGDLDVATAVLNNGVHLSQPYGYLSIQGSLQKGMLVNPGDTLSAGYAMSMPGKHESSTVQFVQPAVTVPVSCTKAGTVAGQIVVDLAPGPYRIASNSNSVVPTNQQSSSASFEGSATAPNLCNGASMYDTGGATFTGQVLSTDPLDRLNLQFHYLDPGSTSDAGWSPTATVNPFSPVGQGTTVGLSTPWGASTWDSSNWSGLKSQGATTSSPTVSGLDWSGSAWNGSAWNGSAWNGSAWNGSAWNGSAWNGSAWNGSAWNGSAWNGAEWG